MAAGGDGSRRMEKFRGGLYPAVENRRLKKKKKKNQIIGIKAKGL